MPGLAVFQDSPSSLKNQIYGFDGTAVKQIMTDTSGRITVVTASGSQTSVTATDFDIRDLNNDTDDIQVYGTDGTTNRAIKTDNEGRLAVFSEAGTSVTVSATDFGIRTITQATDSIVIYGNDGTDNKAIATDATGQVKVIQSSSFTNEDLGSVNTGNDYAGVSGQDISAQESYSFFVKNTGTADALVKIQLSPDNTGPNWVDDGSEFTLQHTTNNMVILTANKFLRYIRLAYKSAAADAPTALSVIFQAQS